MNLNSEKQTPQVLSGREVSQQVQSEIIEQMDKWKVLGQKPPHLVVILVGEDPASQVYVGHKEKMCHKLGFQSQVIKLPSTISQSDLITMIQKLNSTSEVDALMVQLPLPQHLNTQSVLQTISPQKDADCLTESNLGRLLTGHAFVKPCTPAGILEMLKFYKIDLEGKKVAVVGRSLIVGIPLFHLLTQKNATVTLFHSKSLDLRAQLKNFDLVCVATGAINEIKSSDLKSDAILIDVGIHRRDQKICGDVQLDQSNHLKAYTPVPGGVGVMTIAMLMKNTLQLATLNRKLN